MDCSATVNGWFEYKVSSRSDEVKVIQRSVQSHTLPSKSVKFRTSLHHDWGGIQDMWQFLSAWHTTCDSLPAWHMTCGTVSVSVTQLWHVTVTVSLAHETWQFLSAWHMTHDSFCQLGTWHMTVSVSLVASHLSLSSCAFCIHHRYMWFHCLAGSLTSASLTSALGSQTRHCPTPASITWASVAGWTCTFLRRTSVTSLISRQTPNSLYQVWNAMLKTRMADFSYQPSINEPNSLTQSGHSSMYFLGAASLSILSSFGKAFSWNTGGSLNTDSLGAATPVPRKSTLEGPLFLYQLLSIE